MILLFSAPLNIYLLRYSWCTLLCKLQVYSILWFTIFKGYTPFIDILKYWLNSLHCTIYLVAYLLYTQEFIPVYPLLFLALNLHWLSLVCSLYLCPVSFYKCLLFILSTFHLFIKKYIIQSSLLLSSNFYPSLLKLSL